jgi:hypothetical protein
MKLPNNHPGIRRRLGIMLIECLVYLSVFVILLGLGTAAFYMCWDHSMGIIYATNNIESALRAGECWRADVRGATGKISVETNSIGETVRIPAGDTEIVYRWSAGKLRREVPSRHISRLLLNKVKSSEMKSDQRGPAQAWCWELELAPRQPEKTTHLPLLFTFEAARIKP